MKNKKIIIIIAIVAIVAAGVVVASLGRNSNKDGIDNANVSNNDNTGNNNETGANNRDVDITREKQGYYFEYKGIKIGVNDDAAPILEALGEPMYYFEAPSCAYEGMDRIYSYSGFEFTTFTEDDKEYIASIVFLDDTVTTREGITLNATLEDIEKAYGSKYEKLFNQYSYSDGNCVLSFIVENNAVVSVEYALPAYSGQEG